MSSYSRILSLQSNDNSHKHDTNDSTNLHRSLFTSSRTRIASGARARSSNLQSVRSRGSRCSINRRGNHTRCRCRS